MMAKKISKNVKKSAPKIKFSYPEEYTAQTILKYIAEKHAIPKSQAQEIVDDLFDVINAGVIKGARVPIGKFGKIFIKLKPATKERVGRNPLTGQEITIAAKPAKKVPKFTFSKSYKEEALKAAIK